MALQGRLGGIMRGTLGFWAEAVKGNGFKKRDWEALGVLLSARRDLERGDKSSHSIRRQRFGRAVAGRGLVPRSNFSPDPIWYESGTRPRTARPYPVGAVRVHRRDFRRRCRGAQPFSATDGTDGTDVF